MIVIPKRTFQLLVWSLDSFTTILLPQGAQVPFCAQTSIKLAFKTQRKLRSWKQKKWSFVTNTNLSKVTHVAWSALISCTIRVCGIAPGATLTSNFICVLIKPNSTGPNAAKKMGCWTTSRFPFACWQKKEFNLNLQYKVENAKYHQQPKEKKHNNNNK